MKADRRWEVGFPGKGMRPFSIVIILINGLLFWSLIDGFGQDTSDLARGLGFAFNLIVWASIDAILLTVWVVTKAEEDPYANVEKDRYRALRSWAKRCAYCDELVRRGATKCPHCVSNIDPERLAQLGWKPPAGERG